jgi:SPP1 family predicted phage head-tail adaptor
VNIGKLKHRITFISKQTVKSPNGFKENTWIEEKKTWSNIKKSKRSKRIENDREIEEVTIEFEIRYQTVDENHRIRYGGKDYEITDILDENFEKRYLTITAKEVK